VSLARGFGAKITILHVLEKTPLDPCAPMDCFEWEMQKNEARRYLNAIKADIGNDSLLVATELMEGRPAEQINFWINTHDVDLTVLSSHGSNGKSQWSLASTTQKLIADTPSAILLIPVKSVSKIKEDNQHSMALFRRILVPLDGSSWAESALPFAINIANHQHCEMVLAHVIPESGLTQIEPLGSEGLALEQKIIDYNNKVASHYLNKIESRLKSTTNISVNTSLICNHGVSHELIKIIENQEVDIVVMSAHGNSNHKEQFCGRVALDFLAHCPIPVMLLRGQMSQGEIVAKDNYSSLESTLRFPSQAVS
jgi:nucleotide-binding universal stress UspA family protein